ncbi:hypothetical protein [Rubrivirga marina]|uniref:Uncharacterized protein n=1 Tax=Rubrivirga marina TaxID=1196024 RepID=A0A271J140_9BACT|nr:hypothetical protein [Rubrivirga marina]PAP77226.1 hypothetical protein BSZ37_12675 [Rubrivirga marina]
MTYLPHSLRWRSVGADGGAPGWSPWHAMASLTVTLCEVVVMEAGDAVERAEGFGAVTCAECIAVTTSPVRPSEVLGGDLGGRV